MAIFKLDENFIHVLVVSEFDQVSIENKGDVPLAVLCLERSIVEFTTNVP